MTDLSDSHSERVSTREHRISPVLGDYCYNYSLPELKTECRRCLNVIREKMCVERDIL